jgi:hypothetical protein
MDGSESNVKQIIDSDYFWKYSLAAKAAFIDAENINDLLSSSELDPEIGLLHIDLDGNDYWIWKSIEVISPIVAIIEYNSVFGMDRPITIPYDKGFNRSRAHPSNLYFGASLPALWQLSRDKGYAFIGCNSAGNNAYFVRRDKLSDTVCEVSLESGYVLSKYRESRDQEGRLTYLGGTQRLAAIKGLPVYNTATGIVEEI